MDSAGGRLVCYLGLGSNLGDRARLLASAVSRLSRRPATWLRRVSSVYETEPVADEPQPLYLNLVVALETALEPLELLHHCQAIETALGRTRPYAKAPRTMDIDLLWCGGRAMDTPELTLPHPRILERQFVLIPLAEVAPQIHLQDDVTAETLASPTDADVRRVGRLRELVKEGAA